MKQSAVIGMALGGAGYVAGVGDASGGESPAPLRPPGALPEDEFSAVCIRCMRCVDACPNHALVSIPAGEVGGSTGAAGTPTLHMRKASCMLCAGHAGQYLACTAACPSGALQLIRRDRREIADKVHIGVAEIDFALCYSYNNWSCGACYRACPLAGDAMTVGAWERPVVHAEACVGCGCCERACIRYPHAIRIRNSGDAAPVAASIPYDTEPRWP